MSSRFASCRQQIEIGNPQAAGKAGAFAGEVDAGVFRVGRKGIWFLLPMKFAQD